MSDNVVTPFTVDVPDDLLTDLRDRLDRVRLPGWDLGDGWRFGSDLDYMKRLVEYWRHNYDWRRQEKVLNSFPQFLVSLRGLSTHFIHCRSSNPDALPLIISHGWPGSVYEFHKIIPMLTEPQEHGGDPRDAFHVVAPSLPGYGWSEAPANADFGFRATAERHAELMATLGYSRYGIQGGDVGARVSAEHAVVDAAAVAGLHLNMSGFLPVPEDPGPLTPTEQADVAAMHAFRSDSTANLAIQGTRALTLSYGLADSPVGLAGWLVEKFRAWSDCGGDIGRSFTMDELLTDIMIYWVTNTIATSFFFYRANRSEAWTSHVDVPTAVAIFPAEMSRFPRHWIEPHVNLVRYKRLARGGHFAALEEPSLLVEDVREFFRSLR